MFQKIAKHRANDASNDVHRPPLGGTRRGPIAPPLEVRVAAPLEVPGDKLLDKSFQV